MYDRLYFIPAGSPIARAAGALLEVAVVLWSLTAELGESSPWHTHRIVEFMLCRAPGGRVLTDDEAVAFETRRTILVPPMVRHRFSVEEGESIRAKVVCMTREEAAVNFSPGGMALLQDLCAAGISFVDHDSAAVDVSGLTDLIADGFGSGDATTQRVNWSTLELLLVLHRKALELEADGRGRQHRHQERLQAVVDWLEVNLEQPHTIDETASRFGFSRSLFTREFRNFTGRSLVDYLNIRRVEKAAMDLVRLPVSVTEVAQANGFSNLSLFHRRFKAHYGMTPNAFRRKIIEEGGLKLDPEPG